MNPAPGPRLSDNPGLFPEGAVPDDHVHGYGGLFAALAGRRLVLGLTEIRGCRHFLSFLRLLHLALEDPVLAFDRGGQIGEEFLHLFRPVGADPRFLQFPDEVLKGFPAFVEKVLEIGKPVSPQFDFALADAEGGEIGLPLPFRGVLEPSALLALQLFKFAVLFAEAPDELSYVRPLLREIASRSPDYIVGHPGLRRDLQGPAFARYAHQAVVAEAVESNSMKRETARLGSVVFQYCRGAWSAMVR